MIEKRNVPVVTQDRHAKAVATEDAPPTVLYVLRSPSVRGAYWTEDAAQRALVAEALDALAQGAGDLRDALNYLEFLNESVRSVKAAYALLPDDWYVEECPVLSAANDPLDTHVEVCEGVRFPHANLRTDTECLPCALEDNLEENDDCARAEELTQPFYDCSRCGRVYRHTGRLVVRAGFRTEHGTPYCAECSPLGVDTDPLVHGTAYECFRCHLVYVQP